MSILYLFTTQGCSKCPEAKRMISDLNISCEIIEADLNDENMIMAQKFSINSVPTFVELFDDGQFTIHSKGAIRNLREQWKK